MGLRLLNNKIKLNNYNEINSTVVTKGTIQVPRDGNPIILMSDSQSTGGYPIIGNICRVDIQRLLKLNLIRGLNLKL